MCRSDVAKPVISRKSRFVCEITNSHFPQTLGVSSRMHLWAKRGPDPWSLVLDVVNVPSSTLGVKLAFSILESSASLPSPERLCMMRKEKKIKPKMGGGCLFVVLMG